MKEVVEFLTTVFRTFESLIRFLGPTGATGLCLSLIGTTFLVVRIRQEGPVKVQISLHTLEDQTKNVFGDISLLERNEESRTKVSNVLAVWAASGRSTSSAQGTYGLYDFLLDLKAFLELPHDDSLGRIRMQDRLTQRLNHNFDPPYLKCYVQSLIGLQFLIAGQDAHQATAALPSLEQAISEIETKYPNARSESIVNARGICHGLRIQAEGLTLHQRLEEAIRSDADFIEALRIRRSRPSSEGDIVLYRALTNHAEWCLLTYSILANENETDRAQEAGQLLQHFSEIDKEFQKLFSESLFDLKGQYAGDCIGLLLTSACKAGGTALSSVSKSPAAPSRPAIYYASALIALTVQHEQFSRRDHKLPPYTYVYSQEYINNLNSSGALHYLNQAAEIWKKEEGRSWTIEKLNEHHLLQKYRHDDDTFSVGFDKLVASLRSF